MAPQLCYRCSGCSCKAQLCILELWRIGPSIVGHIIRQGKLFNLLWRASEYVLSIKAPLSSANHWQNEVTTSLSVLPRRPSGSPTTACQIMTTSSFSPQRQNVRVQNVFLDVTMLILCSLRSGNHPAVARRAPVRENQPSHRALSQTNATHFARDRVFAHSASPRNSTYLTPSRSL